MAEVKNSFLSSKMNKDLDDRLIPNSEYRDALNIEVGKSETNNIGVLQNVYGNVQIPKETITNLECIGIFMDNQNNRIYQFLTNYSDPTPSQITLAESLPYQPFPEGWVMKITVYDLNTLVYSTLVEGTFLNFSKTNLVIGVNLIEGLLFWSDNRNQPRKINYNKAISNPIYYTTEAQISVAKYAPVEPISLVRKATATVVSGFGDTYVLSSINGIITNGMSVVSTSFPGSDYGYVMDFTVDTITLYQSTTSITAGDRLTFLISTMSDKSDDANWPGDPAFLEDKYVRFSYRFKFDDNEYSIMAPFTQIAYIPRQKGYFINGDETAAYRSTIIKWMENYVNNIELLIPLPDKGSAINNSYKITDVEVLYKESDALAVKVIDSISWVTIKNAIPDTNIYAYPYQSQKPYKTLNENQTTRVYDIVPTRALGQEISGNRIMYSNFYTTYTPPQNINYNTAVQPKSDLFTNFVEYPNHTLKQNRNYQIGFILADKFGRQSSVLLSSVDLQTITPSGSSVVYGGSTVYAPYQSETAPFPDVRNWFGNALLVLVNTPIASQRNIPQGTPGLYAEPTSPSGFAIVSGSISGNFYTFKIDTAVAGNVKPIQGNYLRGAFTDYVKVLSINATANPDEWIVATTGVVNNLYLPAQPTPPVDTKFAYTLNEIGWYSYKVVVKQQQQDYYNAYLPGMLDGYPAGQTFGSQIVYTGPDPELQNSINTTSFPIGEEGKTSHIVLINDNINKIPRDLTEVGPDQKQYRSSVQLFGRVENTAATRKLIGDRPYNNQYATTITYTLATTENANALKEIKPGDGIQCDEANSQLPNPATPGPGVPPTIDNPQKWYANTVVVSNGLLTYTADQSVAAVGGSTLINLNTGHDVISIGDTFIYTVAGVKYSNTVDSLTSQDIINTTNPITPAGGIPTNVILYFTNPSKGQITFTPPNWTRYSSDVIPSPGAYINFTITKAENIQYFPVRKADVVSSIATSTDFNFLENTVDNIKGTAGLNFYQLQTRPLIGRVSTTKSIGVINELMVPFLSVYETTPDVSALALFWETASTGLISDLNYDVSNGFDGPSQFGDLIFSFFEDQDPAGLNTTPGDSDSKYITSSFSILNNTGFPIPVDPGTTPYFTLVTNNNTPQTDVTSKFGIEEFPVASGTYRFIIKDDFVFDHYATENSEFNFYVNVAYGGTNYTIIYRNRLANIVPNFISNYPAYNKVIDQTAGFIVKVDAVNGSHSVSANLDDLYWSINSGDPSSYFNITPNTGELFLQNPAIPLGTYELFIKVQDAFLISPPTPIVGVSPYDSKQDIVQVNITVGPKPVNKYLQDYTTPPGFVFELVSGVPGCVGPVGEGYGAVYIGKSNLSLDPITGKNSGLPDLTNTSWNGIPYSGTGAYQNYYNVQIENGADFIVEPPEGLTQGQLEFTIRTIGTGITNEKRTSLANFILYFREPTAPNNTWQSILDNNNVGSPNSTIIPFQNGVGDSLGVRINDQNATAERSTSLVISNPTGVVVGEYCLVVYHQYTARPGIIFEPPLQCGYDFYTIVNVRDANYTYTPPSPVPDPVVPIEYSVQLAEPVTDYPGAVPYNTQDASIGFPFSTTATSDTTTTGNNLIKLTVNNPQIVPGLYLDTYGGKVADILADGVTIVMSVTLPIIPGGTDLIFRTINGTPLGSVYATTNNPLHVKQFYSDSALATLWEPPVADKFYLFFNTLRDYNESTVSIIGMGVPTNKPICCAQFDAIGQVIPQTFPDNTIQTAWLVTPETLANYGRNLYQYTAL